MPDNRPLDQALDQIVQSLHGPGRLRVWSIIISAFGDIAPSGQNAFPASALQAVMDRLDIGPGAVRTALSRLAKDGWIERSRAGRTMSYRLTDSARREFELASHRIYGVDRPIAERPSLVIVPDGSETQSDPDLVAIRRGVFLRTAPPRRTGQMTDAMVIPLGPDQALPRWIAGAVEPPGLAMAMDALVTTFTPLSAALAAGQTPDPLAGAAARTALIHAWRRIALRHPQLPDVFLPDEWPEAGCRRFVMALHAALSPAVGLWQAGALENDETLQR